MSGSKATANLIGNLGKDAVYKFLPSGTPVLEGTLAVNSGFGDKKTTTWFNWEWFGGKRAEAVVQYCGQGSNVAIDGEMTTRLDKNGKTQIDIKVTSFTMLDMKARRDGQGVPSGEESQAPADTDGLV